MKSINTVLIFCILMSSLFLSDSFAQSGSEETKVTVRAKSKDAKFIGTSMGGALITITDAVTGEILAKGLTKGSTGDTQKLMRDPVGRYTRLSTPGAAKFESSVQLTEPRLVTITATAPMAKRQARVTSSTQTWLIPGKDITGDGIVMEIPGFVVDILNPQTHQTLNGNTISIKANIVMMCGCPTSDGGLWDSSDYAMEATIKRNGNSVESVPLMFTGQTSTFSAEYEAEQTGVYEIIVQAFDSKTGNAGVDKTTVIIRK